MDAQLAGKIIGELKRFSDKKYAILSKHGNVLAKSDSFKIEHDILDTTGQKPIALSLETKKLGYVYIDEDAKTLKQIGPIVKSMAELIAQQVKYTEILTSDEKRIDQLAYDFFHGKIEKTDELSRILRSFSINLEKDRVAISVEIADPSYLFLEEKGIKEGERERKIARTKRSIENLLESFYSSHPDNLVFYMGSNNFVILKDMGSNPEKYQEDFKEILTALHYNLKTELMTDITVGVGNFRKGATGIRESYEESQTALELGKQMWNSGKIFHFDSFGVVAPLYSGSNSANISFSKDLLSNLKKHPELAKTLSCYLENNLSLSKTAKKLKIHRNTLVYRLEKIGEITTLDPRVFADAFQLQMSLMLARYNG